MRQLSCQLYTGCRKEASPGFTQTMSVITEWCIIGGVNPPNCSVHPVTGNRNQLHLLSYMGQVVHREMIYDLMARNSRASFLASAVKGHGLWWRSPGWVSLEGWGKPQSLSIMVLGCWRMWDHREQFCSSSPFSGRWPFVHQCSQSLHPRIKLHKCGYLTPGIQPLIRVI